MQKCALVIATSAFILACGALAASAQQTGGPMTQQREGLERQIEGAQTPRRAIEGDRDRDDDRYGGGMMGRGYGPGWRHHQDWSPGAMDPGMMGSGMMGSGMMGRAGMTGPGNMGSGVMMRMLFTLMDSDGDGTVSLQEFQAAHERIFKGLDANKDGRLTLEEIQAFMQGTRAAAPRQ
jgi:hypothetical protein